MNKDELCLAIDQGSLSSRALVIDAAGATVVSAQCAVASRYLDADKVEQDPVELLNSVRRVIDECVQQLGARAESIGRAGLATQRSSIVGWSRVDGQALTSVISWQDRRAASWLWQFRAHTDRVHNITGLVLSPHYGASKMAWCIANEPKLRSSLEKNELALAPLSSFLLFNLLDEQPFLVDPANASRTLLWDYQRGDWSSDLLQLFGVPRAALPRCVPSRFAFGSLTVGDRKVPLGVVTGDQSAALFAFGEPAADTVYANLGTGAFLQQIVGEEPVSAGPFLSSVVHQEEARSVYVVEATVNGAGSAIKQVSGELGLHLVRQESMAVEWLETVKRPLLFLNGVSGLAAPWWIDSFESQFIGNGDIPESMVAVYESIIFLLCTNLNELALYVERPRRVIMTGGLAQIDPLCQRLADLSMIKVCRPVIHEATAVGLAWLQGAGHPEFKSAEFDEFVPRPAEESHEFLERYELWLSAMETAVEAQQLAASATESA
ncbi:MAG: FGGY family carbohydrate kinase [Gammaproteobacteria bacterium]